MLLKMLSGCDYAIQECNQILTIVDGEYTSPRTLTENAVSVYGEYKVVNVYPRTDGVYGVIFEIECPA